MSSTTRTHTATPAAPAHARQGPGPVPADHDPDRGREPTIGALVKDLTEQIPELIRSELRLAQAELGEKGKRAGVGLGLFGTTGLLAFLACGTAVTAGVLGLAEVMPGWAAALVVTGVLLVLAGIAALVGRGQVRQATPPVPEHALEGLRRDAETLKGARP